jgi:tetratricopeptide (TPR) repeat protein
VKVFVSCVSGEFKSYRLKLANHLSALRDRPCEVKVQEDFQQGGYTLLDKLADYLRECDLVIHLAGDACGARPTPEHVRALFHSLGVPPPDPLPERSYTQWEFHLALRFKRKMLVYFAAADAPRDCALPVKQTDEEARLQRSHREAIRQTGKHYGGFTSYTTLVREVFHDLGLEHELKINNLPYKSLGSLFKGRKDFLRTIHQTLGCVEHVGHQRFAAITASATAAAVYGLGGIGKTRAAIEYAHSYAQEYTALLFVRADSPDRLQQNLAALCGPMVLDLPEKSARETELQVAAVLRWLQQHAGWLLIFDNVDTEEAARAVQELLGKLTPSGQVLVTSRLSRWEGAVESLALDVLEEVDACAFLLERTQHRRRKTPDDEAQARAVAVELGRLALALEQAGAYIDRYRLTFADYLAEWHERRGNVLEWFDERVMQYPMSVAVTWRTSFDRISEPARRLLRITAWLAADPIPEFLLEAAGGPLAVEGGDQAEPAIDPREALADLEAHSLVMRADETASFVVHRLVQDVTRRGIQENDRQRYLKAALRWIDATFVGDPEDVRTWPVLSPIAPHALAAARYADAEHISEPTARLMNDLGLLYHARAQYTDAEPLLRRALAIDEDAYGPDHLNVAMHLNNLCLLLKDTNRPGEAETLMRRSLAIHERTYSSDHPQVATSLNNLASLLQDTNQLGKAEPLIQRALAIDEKFYGPNHPNVAIDLNTLGGLLKDTNRPGEAELPYRRALAIDEKFYGPNHPNVAIDLNNLGYLLLDTNRPGEAEPLLRRALTIDEDAYGPDHPNVAIRLNNLGHLLKNTNRPGEAEALYHRAVAINEKCHSSDHPDVAICLSNLALLQQATGRLGEAELLMRRVVKIFEQAYGSDHPKVAVSLANLALLLEATNRLGEAELLMRRHLEIFWKFTRDTGHEHPHLRAANANYSVLLLRMGYSEEQACAKLKEIARRYGRSLGE